MKEATNNNMEHVMNQDNSTCTPFRTLHVSGHYLRAAHILISVRVTAAAAILTLKFLQAANCCCMNNVLYRIPHP